MRGHPASDLNQNQNPHLHIFSPLCFKGLEGTAKPASSASSSRSHTPQEDGYLNATSSQRFRDCQCYLPQRNQDGKASSMIKVGGKKIKIGVVPFTDPA